MYSGSSPVFSKGVCFFYLRFAQTPFAAGRTTFATAAALCALFSRKFSRTRRWLRLGSPRDSAFVDERVGIIAVYFCSSPFEVFLVKKFAKVRPLLRPEGWPVVALYEIGYWIDIRCEL